MVVFMVITAFCRKSIVLPVSLACLPLIGEYIQPILAKLPDKYRFWFAFEYQDIFWNFIGALIGTGIVLVWLLLRKK